MSEARVAARVAIGVDGLDPHVARARLEALADRAPVDAERAARIDALRLRIPLEQDEGDEEIFEAYRALAREWNVAEPPALRSHRRWLGPWIVRAKRLVQRAIAFEVEPALQRQARFNRAVLDLMGLLLAEIGRLRRRVRELESTDRPSS